ncbi:MAG TPA: hypothetical protein VGO00_25665, partial [Kofleriaceae bacterium]|nr:hypothetical protein [Kofleriaceae bacterium]
TSNEHAFVARGNILGARLAAVWRARVLLVLGRLDEGRALLADVSRLGGELPSIQRAVERSRLYDPLLPSGSGPVPPPLVLRQRIVGAVAAAAAGDTAGVHKRLRGIASAIRGPGHALERALFHLVRARLASATGDRKASDRERRHAEVEGAEEADPSIVAQLAAAIGLGAGHDRDPIILDVAAEALRCGKRSIALSQRPALRQLLYLLAGAGTVDKTTLATALWGAAYKPATHDNALWVNMARLRKLVSPIGLAVQTNDIGYRLVAPSDLVVVGSLPPRPPSKAE